MIHALLALLLSLPAAAQAPRIGAAGAVSGQVSAGSGGARRALKSGSEVFHKDSVTTDAKGRLQVLLLDQTVFTVGPDSNIVLDEFVYDPFTDTGKVTAQVTKGVFRFVTGKVAGKKPADMKIKIPAGTIGIRGTFGAGSVSANGDTLVGLLGPGSDNNGGERVGGMDIDTGTDSQSLDEPGTGVTVKSDGDVSEPFTLTPEQTAALNAGDSGEGSGGGSGGSSSSSGGAASEEEGDESASSSAGQETAQAAESSADAGDLGDASSDLGEDTNTASQAAASAAGILNGIATWNDVRTINSGTAHYNTSGSWNFTACDGGGSCANNNSGTFSFNVDVDFGNRTFGSGGSSFSASDSDTNIVSPIFPSVSIPQTSFAALDGNATTTVTSGSCSATFSFNNSDGTAAASMTGTLNYNDGSRVGSGSATANQQPGYYPQ